MSTPDPAARRPRLGRRTAVLAGTAASALLAGATRTTWVQASAPDLTGTAQSVDVLGADAAPAVLALALAGIAASLATSLSSAWVRFLTGPVLLLAGAGAGIAALGVMRAPEAAAGSAVASATGVVGAQIEAETTSWPLLALVPALAVAVIGVLVLLAGERGVRPAGGGRNEHALVGQKRSALVIGMTAWRTFHTAARQRCSERVRNGLRTPRVTPGPGAPGPCSP